MRYYQHPAEIFIAKQSALVKKGMTEEEAFAVCAQEKESEEAALQTEREVSKQQVRPNLIGLDLQARLYDYTIVYNIYGS
jgi:hypothetical protein